MAFDQGHRDSQPVCGFHKVGTPPALSRCGESSQTPRPVFTTPTIKFPAPRHQPYDVINATVEANEIPPEKWYPKGHMPDLIREWPLTEDIEIPNPFAAPPE